MASGDKRYIIDMVKDNDGAGSDLDADLVRGGEPVKLGIDEIVKTDGSFIKNQCTAWAIIDGVNATIIDSYNISSVTKVGTGKYDLAFQTPMNNSNYCVICGGQNNGTGNGSWNVVDNKNSTTYGTGTTDGVGIITYKSDGSFQDQNRFFIAIFGGK
ncbi:hypothetical protein [Nitrosophilus kaiyonis]|uniref:hypothetical protein n=1 Tax=Nitrosophilus kaiyonis TaxID=2930200 RepID=UPI0024922E80|nr:hypothetical protein [Nitrosophilus kaiyonis]